MKIHPPAVILTLFLVGTLGAQLMPHYASKLSPRSPRRAYRMVLISGTGADVKEQRDRFMAVRDDVVERDLVVMSISADEDHHVPVDHAYADSLSFDLDTFQVLLIGKDGQVKERRTEPIQPQEFFDCIDVMPMRISEMQHRTRN